jgi:uncharacterized membrane protein YfcA
MYLLLVALAAFVAASVNAVAGGGTFLTFPTLTGIAGLSARAANVTSTVGLWPGSLSSVFAAKKDLGRVPRGLIVAYSIISLLGGAFGALLLLMTSDSLFRLVIPWLLGFATVIFAFGKRIAKWAGHVHGQRSLGWLIFVGVLQMGISVYGGYFGAGIGVLMLAGLSFTGLEDLHQVNALKVLLAMIINGVAVVIFLFGPIDWSSAGAMSVSSTLGGFFGMTLARKISQPVLRAVILCVGIGLTAYYFFKVYAVSR